MRNMTRFAFIFMTALLSADLVADSEVKSAPAPAAAQTTEKKIDIDKLSETFGNALGRNLKNPAMPFNVEAVIKGIRDGVEGKSAPLSDKEFDEMMATLQEKAYKEKSAENLKAASDFMEKNAKAEGVKEIVPGKLQYKVLKEGQGAVVEAGASPKIHYTGKYENGTVFGTSEEMGGPITIPLDQTIPGFSKGIVGMKEGEKRELYIHPDLGFGTSGQLPPNELIIFDIEVVKAKSDDTKKDDLADGDEDDKDDSLNDDDDYDFFLEEDEEDVPAKDAKK